MKLWIACYRTIVSVPHLGAWGAVKLFIATYFRGIYNIQPRGLISGVLVRGRTSDVHVLFAIFCRASYNVRHLEAPGNIVDAGANAGYATVYFAHRFPDSHIVAVEPEQSNYDLLCANVSKYPRVVTVRAALNKDGRDVYIPTGQTDKWAFQMRDANDVDEAQRVRGITLSSLIDEHCMKRVDILKMDIEGAERELFESSCEWLEKVGTLAMEVHEGCWPAVIKAIAPHEFEASVAPGLLCVRFRRRE